MDIAQSLMTHKTLTYRKTAGDYQINDNSICPLVLGVLPIPIFVLEYSVSRLYTTNHMHVAFRQVLVGQDVTLNSFRSCSLYSRSLTQVINGS